MPDLTKAMAKTKSENGSEDQLKVKKRSGRSVTHSRGGCLTCKRRKLRCPENKPICDRCWNDNRPCSYGILLQWEDDSRKRGIKHGRTTRADRAGLTTNSWAGLPIERTVRHFLNTYMSDIEGDEMALDSFSSLQHNWFARKSSLSYASPTLIPTIPMNDGPHYYLFDYYWQCVCENMALIDGSQNVFRHLILPLALSSESVMQMVLALGALSLNSAGRDDLYTVALRHKQRSMQLLRKRIAQVETAVNDQNLIVILMLCVFEMSDNCQTSWSTHLCAAVDLMRIASNESQCVSKITPDVLNFVSRFFLVKDALGRTACGKRAKIKKQLPPINSKEIDPSIGCSYELIDLISATTDLSRAIPEATADPDISAAWFKETVDIDDQLACLTQHLPTSFAIDNGKPTIKAEPEHLSASDILLRTSNLIQTSARLYFLATLRSIDPNEPVAKQLVRDVIEWTRPLSPTHLRSAHLWPLFVAAVYATGGDEERVFFLDQFDALDNHHSALVAGGSVRRVREIVVTVWKRRDLATNTTFGNGSSSCGSSPLSETSAKGSMLMENDWAKYVQPLSEGLCLG